MCKSDRNRFLGRHTQFNFQKVLAGQKIEQPTALHQLKVKPPTEYKAPITEDGGKTTSQNFMLPTRVSESSANTRGGAKISGFTGAIDYNNVKGKKKRPRKRNIVWFDSPFSHHVSTNIGRNSLKLLDRHFPPKHRLRKICNRSNIKVSCMPNMEAIISRENK